MAVDLTLEGREREEQLSREEELLAFAESLNRLTPFGQISPQAERLEAPFGEEFLGGLTGGLFGTPEEFSERPVTRFLGEAAQIGASVAASALIFPPSLFETVSAGAARLLPRVVTSRIPSILLGQTPQQLARTISIAAASAQSTAFIGERNPVIETGTFIAADIGATIAIPKILRAFKSAKRSTQIAVTGTEETVEELAAKEGIQNVDDAVKSAKVLTGEVPFESVIKPGELSAETAAQTTKAKNHINKINSLLKEFKNEDRLLTPERKKLLGVSKSLGFSQTKPRSIRAGVAESFSQIRQTIDDLGGLSPREQQIFKDAFGEGTTLVPARTVDDVLTRFGRITTKEAEIAAKGGREFLTPELQKLTPSVPPQFITRTGEVIGRGERVAAERIEEIQNRTADLIDDLAVINIKTQLGFKPLTSDSVVIKKIDEIAEQIDESLIDIFTPTKRQREITNLIDTELKDFAKLDLDAIDSKLTETAEFINFNKDINDFVAKLSGRFGVSSQKEAVAAVENLLEKAGNQFKTVNKRLNKEVKNVLKTFDNTRNKEVAELEQNLELGNFQNIKDISPATRRELIEIVAKAVDDAPEELFPQQLIQQRQQVLANLVDDAGNLKQEIVDEIVQNFRKNQLETLLQDQVALEGLLDNLQNPIASRAYLLFRASIGDAAAARKIQVFEQTSLSKLNNSLSLSQVETFPEIRAGGTAAGRVTPNVGAPADNTIDEALFNLRQDLSEIQKQSRIPSRLIKGMIRKTVDHPALNKLFRRAQDVQNDFIDANIFFKRDVDEALKKQDDFFKALKQQGEEGEAANNFILGIDEASTDLRLAAKEAGTEITESEIETFIAGRLGKQPEFVQKAYRQFRELDDEILKYNDMVKEVNGRVDVGDFPESFRMKEIPRRAGHAPLLYDGDLMVKVITKDADGVEKVIHRDFVTNEEDGFRSIQQFLDDSETAFGNTPGEILLIPRVFVDDADVNILTPIMNEARILFGQDTGFIKESIAKKTLRPDNLKEVFFGGAKKRHLNLFEKRIGLQNAMALRTILAQKSIKFTIPRLETELLARGFEKRGLKNFASFFRTFANDNIGRSRNFEDNIDKVVNGILNNAFKVPGSRKALAQLGLTPGGRTTRALVSTINMFGRAAFLGLNLGSALINMLLAVTNVMTRIGFKDIITAFRNLPEVFAKDTPFKTIFERSGIRLTRGGLGMRESIINIPSASLGSKIAKRFDSIMMFAFNQSEDVTRGFSALAFRNQAEDLAKLVAKGNFKGNKSAELLDDIARLMRKSVDDPDVLNEFAVREVRDTNFIFDATDAPEIFRSVPLKPFFQFKTFYLNELEFLFATAKERPGQFFKTLGAFAALGGVLGLPGVNEVDTVSKTLFGFSPVLFAQEHIPEVAFGGLPAPLLGLNMGRRVNLGDAFFLTDTRNVFGIAPSRFLLGLNFLRRGQTDKAKAILTPAGVRNILNTIELATTGEITNPFFGGTATVSTENISSFTAFLRAATGFKTTEEESLNTIKSGIFAFNDRLKAHRRAAFRRALEAARDGNFRERNKILKKAGITVSEFRNFEKGLPKDPEQFLERLSSKEARDKFDEAIERATR